MCHVSMVVYDIYEALMISFIKDAYRWDSARKM